MQQKIVILSQENAELKQRIQMLEAELGRTLRQQAGMQGMPGMHQMQPGMQGGMGQQGGANPAAAGGMVSSEPIVLLTYERFTMPLYSTYLLTHD